MYKTVDGGFLIVSYDSGCRSDNTSQRLVSSPLKMVPGLLLWHFSYIPVSFSKLILKYDITTFHQSSIVSETADSSCAGTLLRSILWYCWNLKANVPGLYDLYNVDRCHINLDMFCIIHARSLWLTISLTRTNVMGLDADHLPAIVIYRCNLQAVEICS